MINKGQGFGQKGKGPGKLRKLLGKKATPEEVERARQEVQQWRTGGTPAPGAGGKRRYYDATKKPKPNKRNWE